MAIMAYKRLSPQRIWLATGTLFEFGKFFSGACSLSLLLVFVEAIIFGNTFFTLKMFKGAIIF